MEERFNSLPKDKILDRTKLKEFAEDEINAVEKSKCSQDRWEKEEMVGCLKQRIFSRHKVDTLVFYTDFNVISSISVFTIIFLFFPGFHLHQAGHWYSIFLPKNTPKKNPVLPERREPGTFRLWILRSTAL